MILCVWALVAFEFVLVGWADPAAGMVVMDKPVGVVSWDCPTLATGTTAERCEA